MALVSKSKVNTGAVLGGGPHEVGHDSGDVEGQLALRLLRHVCKSDLLFLLFGGVLLAITRSDPS